MREIPGVEALDGVDTLLALLLSALHMSGPLEDLMRGSNRVRADCVESSLREHGALVALGLLLAGLQRYPEALDTWKVCK